MQRHVIRYLLILISLSFLSITAFAEMKGDKNCSCHRIPARFAANTKSKALHALPNTAKSMANNLHTGMVLIPAGTFMMGGDNIQARADEWPKHEVLLHAFWLDNAQVTNAQFREFVKATHYLTTAEQKPDWEQLKRDLPAGTPKPDESKLVPASLVFTPPDHPVSLTDFNQWWSWMPGANWQHPHGPKSNLKGLDQHPVVHASWFDANAYCQWAKKRLPTEAEWEWAARGRLTNHIYPWGNEPIDSGIVKANTWQGEFPIKNTLRDKYYYTAPVKSYPANGYGLHDMAGNVWEWTADWYDHDYYKSVANTKSINPTGPTKSFDPDEPYAAKKALRGGSFLCNESYCSGYRVASRMKSTPDTSMEHVGFRCAS